MHEAARLNFGMRTEHRFDLREQCWLAGAFAGEECGPIFHRQIIGGGE